MSSTIRIHVADDEVVTTQLNVINCSRKIMSMIEEACMTDAEDIELYLPELKAPVLRKVVEWAEFHNSNTELTIADIHMWDEDFLRTNRSMLFDFVTTANCLEIVLLLGAACRAVCNCDTKNHHDDVNAYLNMHSYQHH